MPNIPVAPLLVVASVCTICVEWDDGSSLPRNELFYELQMMDVDDRLNALHGFLNVFNGQASSYTVRELRRSSSYKFRVSFL